MRILLVEDDPATAESVTLMLQSVDMVVDEAMGAKGRDKGRAGAAGLVCVLGLCGSHSRRISLEAGRERRRPSARRR